MAQTPKQKALELYDKFYGIPLYVKTIKQCCNIVVDEMLDMDYPATTFEDLNKHVEYWEQVKEEINKK